MHLLLEARERKTELHRKTSLWREDRSARRVAARSSSVRIAFIVSVGGYAGFSEIRMIVTTLKNSPKRPESHGVVQL